MKRPKPHQLEDESRNELKRLLPTQWVARDKSSDYGIDIEVEIFDDHGISTGLMFYVQLKATEKGRRHTVRLDRSHLEYYDSLDVPTLVVLYESSGKHFYHRWRFAIPEPREDASTVQLKFADQNSWTSDTPPSIASTLRSWRFIRRHDPRYPLPLVPENAGLAAEEYQRRIRILRRAADRTTGLAFRNTTGDDPHIVARLSPSAIVLKITDISIVSIGIDNFDDNLAFATLLYGTIMLLRGARNLTPLSANLADHALREKVLCPNAELAFQASISASSAANTVDLALLNRLHETPFGQLTLGSLLFRSLEATEKSEAYLRLSRAVLDGALGTPAEASVRYSIANFHASTHNHASAAHQFNLARRLDPSYCKRDYFLGEFGAALYNRRHYAMAARLYQASLDQKPSQIGLVRLGDALLFSGDVARAIEAFGAAETGADRKLSVQASLKRWLCETLVASHGPVIARAIKPARDLFEAGDLGAVDEVLRLDPLDTWANYNTGVALAMNGKLDVAVVHFLLSAFMELWDHAAWNNALICAMRLRDAYLGTAVLETAIYLVGEEAITTFRDQFLAHFGPEEAAKLDSVIFDLGTKERDEAVIRMPGPDGEFKVVARSPALGSRSA